MLIERIVDARIEGRPRGATIELCEGRVGRVLEGEAPSGPTGATLDVEGRMVLPAFVDAHVHLDKAFLLADAEAQGEVGTTLTEAIASVARLRPTLSHRRVHDVADQAVARLVRHGVTAARAHVEIDPAVGLELVHLHKRLAEAVSSRILLQLVAFPQRGLELPGMVELLESAMGLGLDVVGGCPYVDSDPGRHLDVVFATAVRHGTPVDLHLDFSDDPAGSLVPMVAERTRAHGMAGRVTVGHVTTLAAMPLDDQSRTLDRLAESGISLIVLPATDLYLAGRGEPGTRSLAPWERAQARGVRVAIANNNLNNPFAPFGNGNILHAAWLAGIVRRASNRAAREHLLDAITRSPAAVLGLPARGTNVGDVADLVVVDSESIDEVVLQAPAVLATLRAGTLTSRTVSPKLL